MIDRLNGPQPVSDAPARPPGRESAGRGDFEQTLRELEERDHRPTHGPQTDSEREAPPSENPVRRLQGEGAVAEVEALLLPWQLISQGTLSQLTRSGAGANQIAGVFPDAATAMPLASSPNVKLHVQGMLPTAVHPGDRGSPIAQPWSVGTARDAVRKSEEVSASRLSTPGLANPWSERLVRWISDSGQRVTAWVRDYGLEETDIPALIHDLQEHASGQSVQLARIVVNGQERWNAEKAHRTEPR